LLVLTEKLVHLQYKKTEF